MNKHGGALGVLSRFLLCHAPCLPPFFFLVLFFPSSLQDELTEVGDGRIVTTALLLLFSLVTLIPFPEVTQVL